MDNNQSAFVDRSMNENLLLNNSSLETVPPSRTRSLGKTSGVSKQNSRDVIVSSKKKGGQGVSATAKSQTKTKKANKDLQNFLYQGTSNLNNDNSATVKQALD